MQRLTQYIGIASLIVLTFAILTYFLISEEQQLISFVHFCVGVGLLVSFIVRGGLQVLRSSRVQHAAEYGFGVTLYSVLFIGVLALVNYVAVKEPLLYYDSTEEKVYTLAPQTKSVLDGLQEPIVIRAFFIGGRIDPALKDLLERMERESSKVSWTVIDPEKKPQLADKYGINEDGSLHFSFKNTESTRVSKLTGEVNEQEIVNSILKLTRGGERKVYTLTGNGERDLSSNDPAGYLFLKEAIEGENIKVEELKLSEVGEVPEDADAVLVLAPTQSLPDAAVRSLFHYFKRGGGGILATEPRLNNNIPEIANRLGIEIGSDIVIDQVMRLFAGPSLGVQPVITTYGEHPITKEMKNESIFSTVSSVRAADPENPELTELAFTGPKSWAEKNLDRVFSDTPQAELEADDIKGPVPVAVAFEGSVVKDENLPETPPTEAKDNGNEGEKGAKESRIVVVGDTDWIANVNISVAFNRDLFLNMLNWTIGEEEGITIRARTLRRSLTALTASQFRSIFLLGAILLPETLLLGGFAVWWFRRE